MDENKDVKGVLKVSPLKANLLIEVTIVHTMSPYCVAKFGNDKKSQLSGAVAKHGGKDPQWFGVYFNLAVRNEREFNVYVYHKRNVRSDSLIGSCQINIEKYLNSTQNYTDEFDLFKKNKLTGKILMEIYFEPGFNQTQQKNVIEHNKEYEVDYDSLQNPFDDDNNEPQQQQTMSSYQPQYSNVPQYQQSQNIVYNTSYQPQVQQQIQYTSYQPQKTYMTSSLGQQQPGELTRITQSVHIPSVQQQGQQTYQYMDPQIYNQPPQNQYQPGGIVITSSSYTPTTHAYQQPHTYQTYQQPQQYTQTGQQGGKQATVIDGKLYYI